MPKTIKKTTTKKAEKPTLITPIEAKPVKTSAAVILFIGAIAMLCTGCAAILGVFGYAVFKESKDPQEGSYDFLNDIRDEEEPDANGDPIKASVGIEAATKLVKEDYPNAVLVQIGDNQKGSLLYYDVTKDPEKGNKGGRSTEWLYIFITEPSSIKKDTADYFYGSYKPKPDQGIIIKYSSATEEAEIFYDTLYANASFHSLASIKAIPSKMDSTVAFDLIKEHFKADLEKFDYKDSDIDDVNLSLQKITYVDYVTDTQTVEDVWTVEIIYNDDDLPAKRRTFSARVNVNDNEIDSDYYFPLDK